MQCDETKDGSSLTIVLYGVQCEVSSAVIRRSIQGMLEELEYTLHEHILVRLVDYGHTFSMDVEMAGLDYGMLHGEAVNIDMALTTIMARNRGLISEEEAERVFNIMAAFRCVRIFGIFCFLVNLFSNMHASDRMASH